MLALPQLCVLRLGLPVDGNVGIGIFPEGEKVLIRLARLVAGSGACGGVERVSASQTVRQLSCADSLRIKILHQPYV